MKTYSVAMMLMVLAVTVNPALAVQNDTWHLAMKFSTIEFVGSQGNRPGLDRDIYAALEAYARIAPGTYVGGEIGAATFEDGSTVSGSGSWWSSSFEFSSLELNLKQVLPINALLDVEGGLGVALVEAGDAYWYSGGSDYTNSYYAGQIFTGFNLSGQHWYGGLNLKYQEVESGFTNVRAGGHVGYRFD
jgi:hypothetical protein